MARKVKDDDRELYEVAVLLLASVKAVRRYIDMPWAKMDALILRAEKALKARA